MRADLTTVAQLIPEGSRVLDLGCGGGALPDHLAGVRGCRGTGVEIDPASVLAAIRRGVPVIELDIDRQLGEFADDSYDVVVLSQTLQATRHPAEVLAEIVRIGRRCIVSVPNFGHWAHRARLLFRGRMPMSDELPHTWYDTPNIHLSTLNDLEDLFAQHQLQIERRILLDAADRARPFRLSNLLAASAVYALRAPR